MEGGLRVVTISWITPDEQNLNYFIIGEPELALFNLFSFFSSAPGPRKAENIARLSFTLSM